MINTGVLHLCDDGVWLWESNKGDVKYMYGTLMQSTSLKDKNGKEIFEGDIVKHRTLTNRQLIGIIRKGEHITADGSWCLVSKGFITDIEISSFRVKDLKIEVIGNIYENPELMRR